ncbi:MAG: ribonuclease P protein component [Bacteroidia bacterium]|nr:ribonuclease P protein component [Bacteroidia bacterium]
MAQTLSKTERLSGKTAVNDLLKKGRWGSTPDLKYCWLCREGAGAPRIMVSVPKRNFKRAVKRNLLKRRLRESYRTQKDILSGKSLDVMFFYNSKEVLDSAVIKEEVGGILRSLAEKSTEK